ncbi:flagellar basal body rod protein FlgC [Jeotgalibaca caeni]|uniref:flagellar basal body rod protein FlgC n=1 Tax=Jeotgalibaca caeni TaxID=3028623 RepID=UPI00237E40D3|nr:flagellar basal body rod protein FlgC [Jeotgalibaca caeni]MDE1548287.1 flagellar basal body rod protein FlgC [Jeotgalibaca caeni]
MSIFDSLHISASGLSLERLKLDTISTNIANVNTTRTEEGGPYQKKSIVFEEALKQSGQAFSVGNGQKSFGVRATEITADETELREYQPTHPDADEEGYVLLSNVNMADEMVEMMKTLRAYDANITSLEAGKDLLKQALTISAK